MRVYIGEKGVIAINTTNESDYTIKPLTRIRKVIAKRMTESVQNIPHVYFNMEINMEKLLELKEDILKRKCLKVSVTDLLIKAVSKALAAFPSVNSSFSEEGIKLFNNVHIGLAVAINEGLLVPVIRNTNKKSLEDIARDTRDLILKARDRKLTMDEMTGSTFTISNLGMVGVSSFTAIINSPECAILAVGQIIKKPVVIHDRVQIKPMMEVTLGVDHRVIDGYTAGEFLRFLKNILEEPTSLYMI